MRTLTPLGDKVIGRMIDDFGARETAGGLIVIENDGTDAAIRPRWFEVTHVGPKQKDVIVGQFVLMGQGRWSRGVNITGSSRKDDLIFYLDNDAMFGVTDDNPIK